LVTVASLMGGAPPIDPASETEPFLTSYTKRHSEDEAAKTVLASTVPLSGLRVEDFDAVFIPGGHGLLWDLMDDFKCISLLEAFFAAGKPVAAVCHGVAALHKVKRPDGESVVKDKRITGFTNSEEAAVALTEVVPFLIEDEFKRLGCDFSGMGDWAPHVVVHGKLVTGQNPQSSEQCAKELVKLL
jgi:putative intracellular protease/amidase